MATAKDTGRDYLHPQSIYPPIHSSHILQYNYLTTFPAVALASVKLEINDSDFEEHTWNLQMKASLSISDLTN